VSAWSSLRASTAYADLLAVSERLGRDPLQVQGPGGNTSLKENGAMWVKASGLWLAEARARDIMVPVDADALTAALHEDTPDVAFVPDGESASALRPSIETSFHAALPWPVVIHTHCVATIALAVRTDAETVIAERLGDLGAAFVPYVKPGRDLTRAILAHSAPATRVIVLGNHGLICCGDNPVSTETLLRTVSTRLEPHALPEPGTIDPHLADQLAGTDWMPAPAEAQPLARDPVQLGFAGGATLYPDHLVFLGPGVAIADHDDVGTATEQAARLSPPRRLLLFPGRGAAIPKDSDAGTKALARALGDVVARIAPGAEVNRLTQEQEADLLNWDAEAYRRSLSAAS